MYSPSILVAILACAAMASAVTTTNVGTAIASPTGTPPALRMPNMAKVEVKDSMPRAKVCTADKQVCVTVTDLGDAIDVMAEAPADAKWLGVGFGKGMPNADILLGYMVNNKFVISDRKASKGKAPAPVDQIQDAIPIRGGKEVIQGKWVSHFQRPKNTGDQDDAVVDLSKPVDMIVAYNKNVGVTVNGSGQEAELRASIQKHTNTGMMVLNLQDKAQVDAAKQTATGTAAPASDASNLRIMSYTAVFAAILAIASVFV